MGKKQSELIREAVDRFMDGFGRIRQERVLPDVAGICKDREDQLISGRYMLNDIGTSYGNIYLSRHGRSR